MNLPQLQWACRRGMLELDILFQRYLEKGYPTASEAEQKAFVALLTSSDQDLFDWLMRKKPADAEHQAMVQRVLIVAEL